MSYYQQIDLSTFTERYVIPSQYMRPSQYIDWNASFIRFPSNHTSIREQSNEECIINPKENYHLNWFNVDLPDKKDILRGIHYDNYLRDVPPLFTDIIKTSNTVTYQYKYSFERYLKDIKYKIEPFTDNIYINKLYIESSECPVCYEKKPSDLFFKCDHLLCVSCHSCLHNQCCPICRSE